MYSKCSDLFIYLFDIVIPGPGIKSQIVDLQQKWN